MCEGQCVGFGTHQRLPRARGGLAVGVGHVLVDAPDGLKGDILIAGKQVELLLLLTLREQA